MKVKNYHTENKREVVVYVYGKPSTPYKTLRAIATRYLKEHLSFMVAHSYGRISEETLSDDLEKYGYKYLIF